MSTFLHADKRRKPIYGWKTDIVSNLKSIVENYAIRVFYLIFVLITFIVYGNGTIRSINQSI